MQIVFIPHLKLNHMKLNLKYIISNPFASHLDFPIPLIFASFQNSLIFFSSTFLFLVTVWFILLHFLLLSLKSNKTLLFVFIQSYFFLLEKTSSYKRKIEKCKFFFLNCGLPTGKPNLLVKIKSLNIS